MYLLKVQNSAYHRAGSQAILQNDTKEPIYFNIIEMTRLAWFMLF